MYRVFRPEDEYDWLYVKRKKGKRTFTISKDIIDAKIQRQTENIMKNKEKINNKCHIRINKKKSI